MNPNDILNNENLNYGIIGNCKSAALINADSSIDWCCLPQFDSPSIFANILDNDIGGSFKILCDPSYALNQNYCNKTSILITNFPSNRWSSLRSTLANSPNNSPAYIQIWQIHFTSLTL